MILLLKASLVVMILLLFYKMFLAKESFFSANRMYLLGCMLLACILPFIVLPKMIVHQGYLDHMLNSGLNINQESMLDKSSARNESQLAAINITPIENTQNELLSPQRVDDIDSKNLSDNQDFTPDETDKSSSTKNIGFWLLAIYLFGAGILMINLLAQVSNVILKIIRNKDQIEDEGTVIVNMQGDVEPCSFFNYIFINPANYDFDTYEQIIAHEKVHVTKHHSIDLILSEIAIVILWFNPFVWLLRKEVEKNIEYQTDEALVYNEAEIKELYQLNLVKIACKTSPLAITTNYNQSLIKQRILRMNAKRSNQFNYWKYAFSMPMIFVLVLMLNRPLSVGAIPLESLEIYTSDTLAHSIESADEGSPIESEYLMKIEAQLDPINEQKDLKSNEKARIASKLHEKWFVSECEEFEKAVAAGDLVKVKEILKTLDPDCLKLTKNEKSSLDKIGSQLEVGKHESKQAKYVGATVKKSDIPSVCQRLKTATSNRNIAIIWSILYQEDITCLEDATGGPSKDITLIRGLLSYGARINIYNQNQIHISNIGFEIGINDDEAFGCKDPGYIRLVQAIKADDEAEIRKILGEEKLTCPLNVNGVRNDFFFIKELMKYNPVIVNHERESITVGGIGIKIDMEKHYDNSNLSSFDGINNDKESNRGTLGMHNKNDNGLSSAEEDRIESSCIELIDAIVANDNDLAKDLIKRVQLDCFHRITNTTTSDSEELTTSVVHTPLIAAVRNQDKNLVILILKNDADIDYTGDGSETSLVAAVKTGNIEMVKILIRNNAKLNRKDEANLSALDYARINKYTEIYNYLKSNGAK